MRTSLRQLAAPFSRSAMPGRMKRFAPPPSGTAETKIGSPLCASTTDAYAVALPSPLVGFTSMWPFVRLLMPAAARKPLSCCCWPGLSATVNSRRREPAPSKTLTSVESALPAASTMPRFVRKSADCAICCSASLGSLVPAKFANGTAGMNCPRVPAVDDCVVYVRLVAERADAEPVADDVVERRRGAGIDRDRRLLHRRVRVARAGVERQLELLRRRRHVRDADVAAPIGIESGEVSDRGNDERVRAELRQRARLDRRGQADRHRDRRRRRPLRADAAGDDPDR